ncbi:MULTISPECIES: cold shock domain-containing protein [unclassified Myroides]|uniref:cold-shock protein n=1 Tax=unclassified Myroides TaxID=2642485 RepID=UPI0015F8945D|nr:MULTISPECIES: cold shock domain-containing protein [unclassified Myroides]MBB1140337.1 cold shock domain-containing protein [Myroides sp. WP-1]MBB1149070.1 cold shock domain-containing protein [Myroides sp. NP-2]MDM1043483.1 cold shock domain-containing protein [Myroides sp. R163-1]MDM1054467.1 cold shock domain-containing protein [Myroides sp. 1354]MDM1067763.1 cold shock domain-containing protein [Myroides sp. 1372]
MHTGVIKFFNEDKGFGFITNEATKQDIFVHITGLKTKNVEQGNRVSYEEEQGKKGLIATNVQVIED